MILKILQDQNYLNISIDLCIRKGSQVRQFDWLSLDQHSNRSNSIANRLVILFFYVFHLALNAICCRVSYWLALVLSKDGTQSHFQLAVNFSYVKQPENWAVLSFYTQFVFNFPYLRSLSMSLSNSQFSSAAHPSCRLIGKWLISRTIWLLNCFIQI